MKKHNTRLHIYLLRQIVCSDVSGVNVGSGLATRYGKQSFERNSHNVALENRNMVCYVTLKLCFMFCSLLLMFYLC